MFRPGFMQHALFPCADSKELRSLNSVLWNREACFFLSVLLFLRQPDYISIFFPVRQALFETFLFFMCLSATAMID